MRDLVTKKHKENATQCVVEYRENYWWKRAQSERNKNKGPEKIRVFTSTIYRLHYPPCKMYIAVNMNGTKQWKFHDIKCTVYFLKHAYRVSRDQVLSSDDGEDGKEKGAKVERKTPDELSVERESSLWETITSNILCVLPKVRSRKQNSMWMKPIVPLVFVCCCC